MKGLLPLLLGLLVLSGCLSSLAGPLGFGVDWPWKMIQVDELRGRGLSGKGVVVAIVDTGIDLSHPEFRGVTVRWVDLVSGRPDPYDDNGHGTHIAGLFVAQGVVETLLSGFLLKGMAPGVTLVIVKAIGGDGKGDESKVAQGIDAAVQAGASIVVLSLGGESGFLFSTQTEDAVQRAISRGVFVVAAAGNAPQGSTGNSCVVASPASVDGTIAVGAVDRQGTIASFSCRGSCNDGDTLSQLQRARECSSGFHSDPNLKPELVAPGVGILSTWKGGRYVEASGTSQAAPLVGVVLALALEAHPNLAFQGPSTVERVKTLLASTARKIGPLTEQPFSHDDRYGYGLVQGARFVDALS